MRPLAHLDSRTGSRSGTGFPTATKSAPLTVTWFNRSWMAVIMAFM